jgi:hypothetical protein
MEDKLAESLRPAFLRAYDRVRRMVAERLPGWAYPIPGVLPGISLTFYEFDEEDGVGHGPTARWTMAYRHTPGSDSGLQTSAVVPAGEAPAFAHFDLVAKRLADDGPGHASENFRHMVFGLLQAGASRDGIVAVVDEELARIVMES